VRRRAERRAARRRAARGADIDPQTLCPTRRPRLRPSRPRDPAQNTFGLSANLDAGAVAASAGAVLVDDCTHGLGGPIAAAERCHGTAGVLRPVEQADLDGAGRFAIARDAEAAGRLRELEAEAAEPPGCGPRAAALGGREVAGRGRIFRAGRAAYRRPAAWPAPASSRRELAAPRCRTTLARLSESRLLGRIGSRPSRHSSPGVGHCRRVLNWLADHGRRPPRAAERGARVPPIPAAHPDRPAFQAAAERAGVDLGDWFVSLSTRSPRA
jgi:hypothetical protein